MDKQDAYLYQRKGPWPQPSPAHPLGEAPSVVHIPDPEAREWQKLIGNRYLWNIVSYWPEALWDTIQKPHMEEVTDSELNHLANQTIFSRFFFLLRDDYLTVSDALYEGCFWKWLSEAKADDRFFITDFSLMETCICFPGTYAAPMIGLWKQPAGSASKHILAIFQKNTSLVFEPTDGPAWELAKYYLLHGANYRMTLSIHALLHFPMDSVNAITKTALPTHHTVFKLLYPHLQFTLPLNNAVLESPTSPVVNNQLYPYTAFTGEGEGFRDMLVSGYKGIEGNPAYPPYDFSNLPPVYSDYGVFLDRYFYAFLRFTTQVVDLIPEQEWIDIRLWAHYISEWIPGFPNGKRIVEPGMLAVTLAKVMWDLSVAHAADHYNYGQDININKFPLRLRIPPPASRNIPPFDRKKLVDFWDVFRYRMEMKMFFAPTNVTLLKDVDYNFGRRELNILQNRFLSDLRETEATMPVKNFIPLNEIPVSIQY
jgi:hypothetical protein